MPELKGFHVWVEVNGARLEEYKAETGPDNVACWIPSEVEKEFSIGFSVPLDRLVSTNHIVDLTLDGKPIFGFGGTVRQNINALTDSRRYLSTELVDNGRATQSFQFGTLELTDDDGLLHQASEQFGEIRVTVSSVKAFVQSPILDSTSLSKYNRNDKFIAHERSKKGLAHCVKFGDQRPIARPTYMAKSIGIEKLCTFVFNYRPMDILMANTIAPPRTNKLNSVSGSGSRSTNVGGSGQASGIKRKADDVKAEGNFGSDGVDGEIQRLEGLRKSKVASGAVPPLKRVKKEHRSTLISGEVIDLTGVKKEPTRYFVPGEVIDLTI
ncbi:hypothetical protein EST38_g7563 [Candolleomyces aberdarensis]|uniref:DUF7918 domain-containing protein n=1 Tax=Candolleomyces aberdarensis TaxID=2316362 RepID=A0A4Q2DHP3_9AGAR|nr:hypothetical protein EST38_g7563 [Candolleomyces aberdarensis]